MASLNQMIANGEVCQCLRSKKLFYQGEPAPPEASGHVPSTVEDWQGPFWCVHTQSLLGPDGKEADSATCRPGRSCCETA